MEKFTKESLKQAILDKLQLNFGCTVEEATEANMMKACAMVLRDRDERPAVETRTAVRKEELRQVHYMSLEFLMGRSLMKNAYNLGCWSALKGAMEELGFKSADIFDMEPDAGLGNGGLGRLAACYLDSLTTLEIPASGYSICYELGIFKQKIVDGQQVELPDDWKEHGRRLAGAQARRDGGGPLRRHPPGVLGRTATSTWSTRATPGCWPSPATWTIAGYGTRHTNTLRLWDAKSPKPIDMEPL